MKVDRMLEIIIYLINHDNVPASYLAERFHVSVRTIQRDMVSISSIGIPVYSEGGKYGGYSMRHMRITTAELSKICRVSQGTVDRALNNRSDISAETKKRIIGVAKQYGYRKYMESDN